MLDVHPPEHAAHTWRDFFIHIATIVIGLLIAIGLEQLVEHFHHRNQAHEAEESLHRESIANRALVQHDFATIDQTLIEMRNGLAVFNVADELALNGGTLSPAEETPIFEKLPQQ
jgi:hypothetical protein